LLTHTECEAVPSLHY